MKHTCIPSVAGACSLSSTRKSQWFSSLGSGKGWSSILGQMQWGNTSTMRSVKSSLSPRQQHYQHRNQNLMCAYRALQDLDFVVLIYNLTFSSSLIFFLFYFLTSLFLSLPICCSMICIHCFSLAHVGPCSAVFPVEGIGERVAQISSSHSVLALTPVGFWDHGKWKYLVAMICYLLINTLFSPFSSLSLYFSLIFFNPSNSILAGNANKDQTSHFYCLYPDNDNSYSLQKESVLMQVNNRLK